MENLKSYSESFKLEFEKFLTGCDSIEEMGLWNLEENGEMDVYDSGDLAGIIIRLIAADGKITEKEVAYLDDMFGFGYTVEELARLYNDFGEDIEVAAKGLKLMRAINEKLAAAYADLIVMACDIIIKSDGVIDTLEIELAKKIKDML